jgi:hypothetical protein
MMLRMIIWRMMMKRMISSNVAEDEVEDNEK